MSATLGDEHYWTKQRRELIWWMEDQAPSFVEGYVGAVRLLYTPSFPARVHFICHVVRDIYRRLPSSLGVKSLPRPAEVFPNMVKELVTRWEKSPVSAKNRSDNMDPQFVISSQVYRQIKAIVQKSKQIAEQPTVGKQLAIVLFRSLDRRQDDFIHPWIIESFDSEYDFFVQRAHLAESMDKVPNGAGLVPHFEGFERAFHSLVGPYFSGKEELDAILQDTNQPAD
ncbi:hypothetical protein [Anaerobaca lacustris]|uniref:Uncharacterized protein n=1 Tax=Anaerobaca lacustris TaxID=3044600 RepID=A0AAW6TSJ5_9BACT|nr:hypothetical protein [Sedimentisphaerales bacterium M17dextr]